MLIAALVMQGVAIPRLLMLHNPQDFWQVQIQQIALVLKQMMVAFKLLLQEEQVLTVSLGRLVMVVLSLLGKQIAIHLQTYPLEPIR